MILTHWVMDSGPTSNISRIHLQYEKSTHAEFNASIQHLNTSQTIRYNDPLGHLAPYATCLRFVVIVLHSQKRHTDTRWCQQALLQGCSQTSWMWFQRRSARRASKVYKWKDGTHNDSWLCKRDQQKTSDSKIRRL